MGWREVGFALALIASLAANAYLFASRDDATAPAAAKHTATKTAGVTPRSVVEHEAAPVAASPPVEAPLPVPAEIAALDRAALEKRLATAEATLEPMLRLDETFERLPRSPEVELEFQPLLDKIFEAADGDQPPYELECHGRICRVQSDVKSPEWRNAMHEHPDATGLYERAQYGSDVYVELNESETAAGIRFALTLFRALFDSTIVADCRHEDLSPGSLAFALRFDRATRRVSVLPSGSLEKAAFGVCARRRFEQIIASTPVPPDLTRIYEEPFPVVSP